MIFNFYQWEYLFVVSDCEFLPLPFLNEKCHRFIYCQRNWPARLTLWCIGLKKNFISFYNGKSCKRRRAQWTCKNNNNNNNNKTFSSWKRRKAQWTYNNNNNNKREIFFLFISTAKIVPQNDPFRCKCFLSFLSKTWPLIHLSHLLMNSVFLFLFSWIFYSWVWNINGMLTRTST